MTPLPPLLLSAMQLLLLFLDSLVGYGQFFLFSGYGKIFTWDIKCSYRHTLYLTPSVIYMPRSFLFDASAYLFIISVVKTGCTGWYNFSSSGF